MADISSITLPGGGTYDLKDKNAVPKYGMGKNLLRNWYFVGGGSQLGGNKFPINLKGLTVYNTNDSYTRDSISGWCNLYINSTWASVLNVDTDGIYFTIADDSKRAGITFRMSESDFGMVSGKQVTISILTENGLYYTTLNSFGTMPTDESAYIPLGDFEFTSYNRTFSFCIIYNGHSESGKALTSPKIYAAKAELGSVQTLAHLEGTAWVLNDYPCYEEELIKYQTSIANPNDYLSNKIVATNVSNKNLLDNWYFVGGGSQLGDGVFPINQRGQTSYSGTGYGIDRWKQINSNIQQVVQSDCLRMNAVSAVSSGNIIYCNFYCPKLPAGTYTLSFLVKEATGSGAWYYSSNGSSGYGNVGNVRLLPGLVTKTFTATGNETSQIFYLWHQNALAVGDHLDIIAAKLECGSEQTLAHQENSAWVLNEIPDYGEELRKCQRYYFDTGANSTRGQTFIGLSNASGQVLSIMIPVPVSMNESNAMTISGTIGWVRGEGGAIGGYSLQSTTVLYKNAILISVNASYGAMRTYGAYFTKLIFSAEQ